MKKVLLAVLVIVVLLVLVGGGKYQQVYGSNVSIVGDDVEIIILPQDGFQEVLSRLSTLGVLDDAESFKWVAGLKKYDQRIKPGRYRLQNGMSNNELVNMLRIGDQRPVRVSFNNMRTIEQLAGRLAQQMAPDSLEFLNTLLDPEVMNKYGFNRDNFITMFIPDTYELYWTDSPNTFVARMADNFKRFWTPDRIAKAKAIGLSQSEVATIASIVQAEQSEHPEEWKTIAGLYLNRIRRNIPLQSDPTVIYGVGDFTIKRVLNRHLKHDSPYNTYIYSGVPPGPIRMPDQGVIDAVLNAERHSYIFMCAKADFSGFHNFSKTNAEHSRYANQYRAAMNKNKVYK